MKHSNHLSAVSTLWQSSKTLVLSELLAGTILCLTVLHRYSGFDFYSLPLNRVRVFTTQPDFVILAHRGECVAEVCSSLHTRSGGGDRYALCVRFAWYLACEYVLPVVSESASVLYTDVVGSRFLPSVTDCCFSQRCEWGCCTKTGCPLYNMARFSTESSW